MKLKGKISIGRYVGKSDCYIEITDELSGIRFVQVLLSAEELMFALTGKGDVDCAIELVGRSVVGKRHESKTVAIKIANDRGDFLKKAALVCAPFEVDGWKADVETSGFSGHRYKNGEYQFTFRRYVEVTK